MSDSKIPELLEVTWSNQVMSGQVKSDSSDSKIRKHLGIIDQDMSI